MTPNEWILSDDTGISSKTIWAVMMEVVRVPQRCRGKYDIPHDPSDFGRCYRLLKLFPEWRKNIQKVGEIFPKWRPMVERWDELTALYEEEYRSGEGPKLWALMRGELYENCMIADGYVRTGKSSWERQEP